MGKEATHSPNFIANEVRAWLAESWQPELPLRTWRERLVDAGWACPTWPVAWHGRGLSGELAAVVEAELAAAGAVGAPPGFGRVVAAPTLLDCASETQRRRHLRSIATGEEKWCELFSEPGSGSDLAGLTTTAEPRDGGWVASGRKAWATGAHLAAWALLLARTDWDVPKHRGLTMFLLPLARAGVTVQPVRLMNGALTHEVVLDGVALEPADVVGVPGGGWSVAQTTLAHERALGAAHRVVPVAAGAGRAVREAAEEHERFAAVYDWIPASRGRPDLLAGRARGTAAPDAATRQLVADALVHERVATLTAGRLASGSPRPVSPSLVKLAGSRTARRAAAAHAALTGTAGLLAGADANPRADVQLSVHAASLIGGTDEIQRTIIAERVLGLPRERQPGRSIPFRDVPTNQTERRHGARAVPDA